MNRLPKFDDPQVKMVYEMLCDDKLREPPNPEEHWEGWLSRNIVAALRASAAPEAWQWRHRDAHINAPWTKWGFVDGPIEAFRVRWANQMRGDPTKAVVEIRPLYAALAPATEEGTVSRPSADRKAEA